MLLRIVGHPGTSVSRCEVLHSLTGNASHTWTHWRWQSPLCPTPPPPPLATPGILSWVSKETFLVHILFNVQQCSYSQRNYSNNWTFYNFLIFFQVISSLKLRTNLFLICSKASINKSGFSHLLLSQPNYQPLPSCSTVWPCQIWQSREYCFDHSLWNQFCWNRYII